MDIGIRFYIKIILNNKRMNDDAIDNDITPLITRLLVWLNQDCYFYTPIKRDLTSAVGTIQWSCLPNNA